MDKIVAEPDRWAGTKFRSLVFTFPQERRA
jgi:hypothetical protein